MNEYYVRELAKSEKTVKRADLKSSVSWIYGKNGR